MTSASPPAGNAPVEIVVGGGPAGLARAYWQNRGRDELRTVVLEAADRPGGWVRTETLDGFTLELGPQGLRPDDPLDELVEALGFAAEIVAADPAARRRFIGRDGRLLGTPMGLGDALRTPLLRFGSKLRLLREPFVKCPVAVDPEESVAEFVARRFGPGAVPLVGAVVSGIFGGSADDLELRSAFPMLARAEQQHGSVIKGLRARAKAKRHVRQQEGDTGPRRKRPALLSFRGGLQGIVDRLAHELGPALRCSAEVVRVAREGDRWRIDLTSGTLWTAEELTLACPARRAAELLRDHDPRLADELAAIPYASIASVYLDLDAAEWPADLRGFGYLLEPGERSPILGVLFCSDVFPSHAPPSRRLCRVMLGGSRFPDVVDRSDEELRDLALDALQRYAGYRGTGHRVLRTARVRNAIPQYVKGHGERLGRIWVRRGQSHNRGLRLIGNSYRAIAMVPQLARIDERPGRAGDTEVTRAAQLEAE